MTPILGGKAGPANVPTILDRLRKFQDADVVFQGVAVPTRMLYDPEAKIYEFEFKNYKLPSDGDINSLGSIRRGVDVVIT